MRIEYFVQSEYNDCEIQKIMRNEFSMSSTCIKRVKLYGIVELNGVHARVKEHVKTGDRLYFEYEDNSGNLNESNGIKIIFENEHYAVVNKPAGMVTHPSYGHLDDSLLTNLSENTLHPVMRLDRETSGLLIVAKDGYSHNMLTNSDIKKSYKALCYGKFEPENGTMDFPIARRPNSVMIRDCTPDGKPSVTHYKTIAYYEKANISLVEFKLETGRCHQIRTHCCHMGHPLLGDGLYGPLSEDNPRESLKAQATIYDPKMGRVSLHAYKIEYLDPFDGGIHVYEAEIPSDMQTVIEAIK